MTYFLWTNWQGAQNLENFQDYSVSNIFDFLEVCSAADVLYQPVGLIKYIRCKISDGKLLFHHYIWQPILNLMESKDV
jgi:hypothetical protein